MTNITAMKKSVPVLKFENEEQLNAFVKLVARETLAIMILGDGKDDHHS